MTYCFSYESLINHPLYKDIYYKKAMSSIPFKKYAVINRDGNCLYSCVGIVFYNFLFDNPTYKEFLSSYKAFFEKIGISKIISETYLEGIEDLLKSKKRSDSIEEYDWLIVIAMLRLIVASYLRIHEDKFKDFLCGTNISKYIQSEIEPMGKRAGELEIKVLSEYLNYQINIFYLDDCSFKVHSIGEGKTIVNLLFTPDHYELLIE